MPIQEKEIQPNQPLMPQSLEQQTREMEIRPEKIGEEYWWHSPWGEVKRVTKNQQRELMRQWLESGK